VGKALEKPDEQPEQTKSAKISRKKRQIVSAEKTGSEEEMPDTSENQPMETRQAKKSRKERQLVSKITISIVFVNIPI